MTRFLLFLSTIALASVTIPAASEPAAECVNFCTEEGPLGNCVSAAVSCGSDLRRDPLLECADGHPSCSVWLAEQSYLSGVSQISAYAVDDFYDEWYGDWWTAHDLI